MVAKLPSHPRIAHRRAVWVAPGSRMAEGSFVICSGAALAWLSLPSEDSMAIFSWAAIVMGTTLLLAILLEARMGARGLLRADLLMLLALYGLTFFEFLFPQDWFRAVVTTQAATDGTAAVLVGFAGLALGRHLVVRSPWPRTSAAPLHFSGRAIAFVFTGCFLIGYFHMLWAVDFDVTELVAEMMEPRFAQPWGRGRLGGWAALLNELGALIYLIPPLAGVILARRRGYGTLLKLAVLSGLAFTLFYGFSSGTRNIFAVHVITFTIAYMAFLQRLSYSKALLIGLCAGAALLVSTHYMLEFRQVGLGRYIEEGGSSDRSESAAFVVDRNLITISQLTESFPERHDFLGLEIPYHALIHPIPRAIWRGKPKGLSESIEEALGASQLTLAVTFVGEAYMSGGFVGIMVFSLLFGAGAAWWNRVGKNARGNFDVALYASGFFTVALGMRSMLWITVAMLPTIALWVYGRWFLRKAKTPGNT